MTDDPFATIGAPKKTRPRVVVNNADLTCVMPVPDDAPPIPKRHPNLGAPTARYAYFSTDGKLLGEIWRFDRGAEKEFRPVSLWRNAKGQLEWRFQIWPDPRPLYGLDSLAAKPNALVVVAEGEKAADAAARLLGGFAVVTLPGGSNAAAKADLGPLRGRARAAPQRRSEGSYQLDGRCAAGRGGGDL